MSIIQSSIATMGVMGAMYNPFLFRVGHNSAGLINTVNCIQANHKLKVGQMQKGLIRVFV